MVDLKHRFDDRVFLEATFTRVKHRGLFNMKELYTMIHEWLIQEEYATRTDSDFPEIYYLHRETQTSGDEAWIWWRLEKVPTNSTYYRYVLDIDFHLILMREAEVIHQGKKFKTNWGEVEIKIWGKLEGDYQHKWRKHPILKHFEELFRKRIFKSSFEMHKNEFYREIYRLQNAIKEYLKLRTYLPEPEETFFPPLGLGNVR